MLVSVSSFLVLEYTWIRPPNNGKHLDEGQALHEGQASFRKKRSCIDNVYTLNEIASTGPIERG